MRIVAKSTGRVFDELSYLDSRSALTSPILTL